MKWYSQNASTILQQLDTSRIAGLDEAEAKRRLEQHGLNELTAKETEPAWKMLLKSFKEPLIVILLIATGLALASAAYDFS